MHGELERICAWCCTSGSSSSLSLFTDLSDRKITQMGQTISGNVLNNAKIPAGIKADVTGFIVQGSTQVIKPGSPAVTLNDLKTGKAMGKLSVKSDGSFVFEPVAGYVGPAPAVSFYLQSSDQQSAISSLALEVLPSEPGHVFTPSCACGSGC